LFDDDRLHRAGGSGSQNSLALRIIGIWVIHERLFATELEHIRRERDALRVSEAPIQVDDNSHG
jgi:hypothetical protein